MFDPTEFAALADQLSDDDNYSLAAKTRTALGRAYYSVMLAVRVAIRNAEKRSIDIPLAGGDHGNLWRTLEDSGEPPLMGLGRLLKDLYEARQKADYQLDPADPRWATKLANPRFARQNAELAKDAISRIPRYDFTPVLGRV